MNDPLHDRLNAAVRADAEPVPLGVLAARARRRRVTAIAAPALALAVLVGGGLAAVDGSGGAAKSESIIASETATPTPSATPSEEPSPFVTPSPTPRPTRKTTTPSPTATATPPPPRVTQVVPEPAGDVRLSLTADRPALRVGDVVRLTVTLTNGRRSPLTYGTVCDEPVLSLSSHVGTGTDPGQPAVTGKLATFRALALTGEDTQDVRREICDFRTATLAPGASVRATFP